MLLLLSLVGMPAVRLIHLAKHYALAGMAA
jgi:hypothetical protein